MKRVLLLGIIIINLFLQTMIYASVFKCTKPDGSTYYSDRPCAVGLDSKKIKLDKKPSSETLEDYTGNGGKYQSINRTRMARYAEHKRKVEESADNGTYRPPAGDAVLIDKLNKHRYKQELIDENERRRKEAIRVAEKKERDRLGKKLREKRVLQTQQALVRDKAKQRINRHKAWMESRERSGAEIPEEDKAWRSWDENTITKKAIYEERVSTLGTKEYKERESEKRNAAQAELRQRQLDIEFNNTRYEGNDIHY